MEAENNPEPSEAILAPDIYLTEESLAICAIVDAMDRYLKFVPKED